MNSHWSNDFLHFCILQMYTTNDDKCSYRVSLDCHFRNIKLLSSAMHSLAFSAEMLKLDICVTELLGRVWIWCFCLICAWVRMWVKLFHLFFSVFVSVSSICGWLYWLKMIWLFCAAVACYRIRFPEFPLLIWNFPFAIQCVGFTMNFWGQQLLPKTICGRCVCFD